MNTLVLDQGGHSSRALVFNPQGKCIAKAQHQLSASIACQQHHIEIDPLKVLLSLQHCIDDILKNHNIFIEQAALICQRSNLLACSRRTLQPITDIISWQDTRNSTALDLSIKNNTLNPERFQCITGLRPNAHLGFSKIQYLLAHNVAIKKHLSDNDLIFMPASAWLAAKLCSPNQSPAEVLCDPSCAQRMGLVDIHSGEWSNELLTLFSIPRHCLPTITDTLHHWGTLPAGIALKLLGGDQSFIPFIASKKMRDESLFINIGSGAFILCESILPKTHSGNGLYSVYKQHKNKHLDPSVLSETIINSAAT
ncbi:MAG: hypothetical protein KAG18_06810, partial [Sinobacterium sp.]|nr:hypothetical protein [Sinobacterium sp.]